MRDSIVKVRLTQTEKANLFEYSERIGATASGLIRKAIHEVCSRNSIDLTIRQELTVLRRSLNAVVDAPTVSAAVEAKRAASRILGRLPL